MLNTNWDGIMTKHLHGKQDETVYSKVVIKHTNEGDVQSFINSFEKELGTNNYKQLFEFPVRWKKLSIDTSDYTKNYFLVEFDEIDFNAKLVDISISRKNKNGIDVFEYMLTFIKDVENGDTAIAVSYLNNKEENEDGKKVFVEYSVKLTLTEETNSVPVEFDAF